MRRFRIMYVLLAVAGVAGCQSFPPSDFPEEFSKPLPAQKLEPGDEIEIAFLDAADMNASQTIRRDGGITLKLIGEVHAAGKTPDALRKELIEKYAPQLQVKEVNVVVKTIQPVFVMGAVMKPGWVAMGHPLGVLEAVALAGGFDEEWAEVRRVLVIRDEGGTQKSYALNFGAQLSGRELETALFYLRPFDLVYVPRLTTPRSAAWGDTRGGGASPFAPSGQVAK
jgi:polysaccharide biosynthesis/export protein